MRKLFFGIAILTIPYTVFSLFMYFIQDNIMFQPQTLAADYKYAFNTEFEEFNLWTPDSVALNALHFKVADPKGLILYYHGNAGNLARWGGIAEQYTKYGYDVMVMDYRGYGKSGGSPAEATLYSDAQLFYEHAKKQYREQDILVFGRSLGTSVSTFLAAENTPGQLILETPFHSIEDVANTRFRYLPVQWLIKYDFPSYKYAPEVNCATLILHGTRDGVVPFSSGQRLFLEFKPANVQFITIPEGRHNNLGEFQLYHKSLDLFIR
ncbi:alpha/beta hydrolase [Gilvibacter sediminis]|uniref:alpha/beta hydrolase n=1 Tax=Gilvibacter sediminis TaxID=379071 RepID=UPI002350D303|nr:alpha/beta fold hydrolase [Gilvibacter sediminis]MDC7998249.1 alpha/beta fold hydrolase [Gilvibacter sediminis]